MKFIVFTHELLLFFVAVVVAVAVAVVVAAAVAVAKQIVAQSLTCRHTTIHFEENKNPAAQLFAAGK